MSSQGLGRLGGLGQYFKALSAPDVVGLSVSAQVLDSRGRVRLTSGHHHPSVSVRNGIFDCWSPLGPYPVRVGGSFLFLKE